MKLVFRYPLSLLALITCVYGSCSFTKHSLVAKKSNLLPHEYYAKTEPAINVTNVYPSVQQKNDPQPFDSTKMTAAQYQKYLQEFYTKNFNNSILPELRKQANTIDRLERDVSFANTDNRSIRARFRHRSDSLSRKLDSANRVASARQDTVVKYVKKYGIQQTQILTANQNTVKICMVLSIFIAAIVGFVFWYFGRRIKKAEKRITALEEKTLSHE